MTHLQQRPTESRTRRILNSRLLEALSFPHGVDAYLQAVNPIWAANQVRARVTEVRSQTADTVTITAQPNANWEGHKAGQYVRLTVEVNGVSHTRCFSPSNSAHDPKQLEFTCKVNDSSVVSRYLRDQAQPGTILSLSQAEGSFALPESRPERIVLISGGSGITPVLSMLRTLCDEGHTGPITFLHYCANAQSLLYADELAVLERKHKHLQVLRCYAESEQGGELEGLFSAEQLQQAIPDFTSAETFLCGPPGLMQRVESAYADAGIAAQLHQEHFTVTVAPDVDPDKVEGEVRFARSERLADNSGDTLLNQAETAGLNPASGCRMGICFACTCRKSSGQVRDIRNGQLSGVGEEDIQLCVSVPVGTVVVDL